MSILNLSDVSRYDNEKRRESFDSSPYLEKPHTVYDTVLENLDEQPQLRVDDDDDDEDDGAEDELIFLISDADDYENGNDKVNEIDSDHDMKSIKKIRKLKRRKSYIYQNLYQSDAAAKPRD